jgi:hypothetical protein
MSLNFDLSRIAEWRRVCVDDKDNIRPITDALIWLSMLVDLGEISKKNVHEWDVRLRALERVGFRQLFSEARGHFNPSREEIEAHVGLRTNVHSKTRAAWQKRLGEMVLREAEAKVKHAERERVANGAHD